MTAPLSLIVQDSLPDTLVVPFKIISRRSWDELQGWHAVLPGSQIEHVLFGVYALIIPPDGAKDLAA